MERRSLLTALAAGVAAALAGCSSAKRSATTTAPHSSPNSTATKAPASTRVFHAPHGIVKAPVPRGTLYMLPGTGNNVALTVDDGTDPRVVAGYAKLAKDTGLRLTFFCNGVNPSWTESASALRPLLEEGQIFMANHTWSHPSLLSLSSAELTDQVRRNETFLKNTYGVLGRPFLRPPFGYRNARVDAQLADLGYPAVTMWYGSLADSTVLNPKRIVVHAEESLKAGHLVIGHANHDPVLKVYDQIVHIITSRHLQPVHLGDVYQV
ncbi:MULTISPECIES: polysaccharide deacetylase family protein [Allobranchiibius]|uniref:Peptidoglycan/xylan/chitin deacetylase (PgdA/CDA1 family) n=1 Tax=Allobranchiibius huperziae TaxID=1874116 RepID=A0A853DJE9_9MICO|nr:MULTISPECIES: polysaccharide deacetylase family protein [Allobranchiibius]MBO1766618.1 polysaccharide deacetylase family protein [Allobranchiibius sp. GilTou38]NYJ74840.1 peptidoglycan/xylan/chitin deacetylase (PgdA/CDA1 family) [Allobranchiibius huperziae]